ncbi:Dyp-type peroxidase [Bacterioplanoides sp.]|uniref:Dyp-type peroxidase n=1 Tax=Bacterioplanoides sp. TaxID=2066072 RepID=UPI003AFFB78C
MSTNRPLDLYDIQGNICKGYGRFGFPKARYFFLEFHHPKRARHFLKQLVPLITTAERWAHKDHPAPEEKPTVTTNIGFTFSGLKALQLPELSLRGFPLEFQMGMRERKAILGDDGPSDPQHWDPVWQGEHVHAWVSINAQNEEALQQHYLKIEQLISESQSGVSIRPGHKGPNGELFPYQDASAVYENGKPGPKEHFGFTDGIGNPYFEGCGNDLSRLPGRGKLTRDGSWVPLATGEFILGHIDEAQEYPPAPTPKLLALNGTFMVYRKLHENVKTFQDYVDNQAKDFDGSKELLMAKFAGRWADNGAPLVLAPDDQSKAELDKTLAELTAKANSGDQCAAGQLKALKQKWIDFTYDDDKSGAKCPVGAHVRRTNTRGSLETEKEAFNSKGALVDRRRLMRRGLPYGGHDELTNDNSEQGIIFMCIGASIERQFEFVQQQWVNYSNDFKLGNDKDVFLGNHNGQLTDKAIIQAEPGSGKAPFFCTHLPRFVETRGGDYFFIPSITALEMIAQGIVDPA